MKRTIIMLSVMALTFSISAHAGQGVSGNLSQQVDVKSQKNLDADKLTLDIIERDQSRQSMIDLAAAPIKSEADLERYTNLVPISISPLRYLSQQNRTLFMESLKFNDRGITGFRYDVLESLSPTQAYEILALFGVQSATNTVVGLVSSTPADSLIMQPGLSCSAYAACINTECVGPGACGPAYGMACTKNC